MTTRHLNVETIPAEARGFHGQPAGLVTRVAANLIDLAVLVVSLIAAYLGVAGVTFLRQGARFTFPIVSYPVAYTAGFLTLVVYFTVSWTTNGRTYGDRVLGLRVRTAAGGELGAPRAAVRALLCALFPLLLVWVAFSRRQRSVQDLVVGTSVIYDWGGARRTPTSPDAAGVAVEVAPAVADEPDHGDAEPLPRLDGQG
ncbi:MAG TPA: RDD family protein [Actinomycetota bacterium]|nr:RDD family protein [Actinomycetota bacterium]